MPFEPDDFSQSPRRQFGLETVKRGVAWYAFQYGSELKESERHDYLAAEKLAREQHLALGRTEPDAALGVP